MRRSLVIGLVIALAVGALALPAQAKKAKPVSTTLYLHGTTPVGDYAEFANYANTMSAMPMDTTKPTSPYPKSMSFSVPVGNDQCTGNPLFPSWEGTGISGKIVGDVTLDAHFASPPSSATARVWVDTPFSSCTSSTAGTDAYVEPLQSVDFDVPAGSNEVKIVFKKLNVPVTANIVVEVLQTSPAKQGRILYDGSGFESNLTFNCIPASGTSCVGS